MRVNKIKVENFKNISEAEITFSNVNYLVGGNNAGKSSILQAIHMAVSCAKLSVERREAVIPESELRYSPTSEFISLGHKAPYENKKDGSRGVVEFFGKTGDNANASYKVEIHKGRNYGNIGVERTGVYTGFGQFIVDPKKLFSIYVPGIAGVPHREEYKSYASVFQKVAGGDSNLVFRNILRIIKEKGLDLEVESLMFELVGKFKLKIDHNSEIDPFIKIYVSLDSNNFVPLDLCGTGVIQILQIVSYVILFKPEFLLIDEPDNHLHPSRQAILARTFEKISTEYGSTVVVSTHSRHLITAASDESKIIWMKNGAVESEDCRDLATILIDLGALDQIDPKGAKIIICTEDKGKSVLEAAVESMNRKNDISVISYNGISNAASSIAIKAMCDLLPMRPTVVIHRDRDFLSDKEIELWASDYKNRGMFIYCPFLCDIEMYQCDATHISEIYEQDINEIKTILSFAILENKNKFRSKFVNKRREAISKYWKDGGGERTDDLWPEINNPEINQIYGKDYLSILNGILEKKYGQRKNLIASPSKILTKNLKQFLSECENKKTLAFDPD